MFHLFLLFAFFVYGYENLDDYLMQHGYQLTPVHSFVNEGYSSLQERKIFFDKLQDADIKRVMEIGFNAGHSAEALLNASGCAKLVSFDIDMHPYTQVGAQYMKIAFGDRFEFISGDSSATVPQYVGDPFDLIFIDGGHSFECCLADIQNCQRLAHKDTLVWIDDYCLIEGVKEAVDFAVDQGILTLFNDMLIRDSVGDRSLAFARYRYKTERERVFTEIYEKGARARDFCGELILKKSPCDDAPYIAYVQEFLKSHEDIHTIVDVGCGNGFFGSQVVRDGQEYVGVDIVGSLIEKNRKKMGGLSFLHLDVLTDAMPDGDLAICKDVLVHLPNAEISKLLKQLEKFKYVLLISDFAPLEMPVDIAIGQYRALDLTHFTSFDRVEMLGKKQILLLTKESVGVSTRSISN